MPFTPFHMGPALAIKAGADRHFSLLAFGFAQVAMDIEPLVGIIRGSAVLHGVSHTYLGALVIGLLASLLTYFIGPPIIRFYNRKVIGSGDAWLICPEHIPTGIIAVSAFIGTFSHVLLDSFMHDDMQPFWPLSTSNSLLWFVPWQQVYQACFWLGVSGAIAWVIVRYLRGRQNG